MKKESTIHLLPEIERPVRRVLKILAPRFGEIREMWNQSMLDLKLDIEVGDMEELACVVLEAHYPTLIAGRAAAYRRELAQCGQALDRRGVPPVLAMIASSLYLETCYAVLLGLNIRDAELTVSLAHLNSASQSLIIVGYSKQHSTNLLRLLEKERRRFSQDLHDEIGHNLIVLKLYIELMARDYKRGMREDVPEKLKEATALVNQSIKSLRRLVLDLGPAALDHLGLLPSFKVYADQFSARTGIKVEVLGNEISELPRVYETALFRVFQGALSNIAKHSKAKRVRVMARSIKGSNIQMTVEDDGVGFAASNLRAKQRFGLTAMQDRVERLGGRFRIRSRQASLKGRPSGTRIDVDLPIGGEAAA